MTGAVFVREESAGRQANSFGMNKQHTAPMNRLVTAVILAAAAALALAPVAGQAKPAAKKPKPV